MSALVGRILSLLHPLVGMVVAVAVWGWIVDRRRRRAT